MTNPITEPTQSIRERLSRSVLDDLENRRGIKQELLGIRDSDPEIYAEIRTAIEDAILSELMEPSEGMKRAAMELHSVKVLDSMVQVAFVRGLKLPEGEPPLWQAYRAMIQHIRSGGK